MNSPTMNAVEISQEDLDKQLKSAQALIDRVSWTVPGSIDYSDPTAVYVQGMGSEKEDTVAFMELVQKINPKDDLLSNLQSSVLWAVRTGLQVAQHVADSYGERSGIPDNNRSSAGLTDAQVTEINTKKQTAAAAALFTFARFLQWNLQEFVEGNPFLETAEVTIPEVELSRQVPALRAAVFYLGKNVERRTQGDDGRMVAVVWRFAHQLQQEILNRQGSFKYVEPFTGVTYLLAETDFSLHGFEVASSGGAASAEVKRVERDDMIGNKTAIDPLFAAIRKLMLWDPERQMNPILSLGNFPSVLGFDGDPGNGKTLLASAGATLFSDLASERGLPHRVLVVPSFVSKYQGDSEAAAKRWLVEYFNPAYLSFGIGDEFEQVCPDHGDDDASEGQKGVATAFLKAYDGVETVQRGDGVFAWMTNYIEIIDKAWLSRTSGRAYVGGAETRDDYVRFLVLMLKKTHKAFPQLVDYQGINWDMNLRAPQVPDSGDLLKVTVDPSATIADLHKQASEMVDNDHDVMFLATFLWLVKKRFKAFSFRDCKNAIEAVTAKVSEFSIPDDFITDPARYAELPYEGKQGLIAELAKEHVSNLGESFASMLNGQAQFFANEALRVADVQRARGVADLKERIIQERVARRELDAAMGR